MSFYVQCLPLETKPNFSSAAMGDSEEVELPPDVSSAEPGDVLEEEVELPPDVTDDENLADFAPASDKQHCSCKMRCFTKFSQETVEFHRAQQLADSNRMAKAFHKIKILVDQRSADDAKIAWAIDETKVCRPFWERYHAVGHKQVDDMVKLGKTGHAQLPERGVRMPREKLKLDSVDLWFLDLYKASEPTPMEAADTSSGRLEDLRDDDPLQHEVVNAVHHPLYSMSVSVGEGVNKQHVVPKRYLNESNLASLWGLYTSDAKVADKVSRDTFTKSFNRHWKKVLQFKGEGQGTRCSLCADMDEERKHCTSKEERLEIDIRKRRHFERHDADRSMNVRSNQLSSDPGTFQLANASTRVVKFMIDGMDQAKFRTPRNLAASSSFAQCHRPALHLTGCICLGLLEAYYILGPDTKKDANMNSTCISLTLDLCRNLLERLGPEHSLPRHAILAADNTPREAKNQIFATYAGSLVHRCHFDTVEVQFMMAGHTKNELDQRFSTLATVLSKAPALETPLDFAECIKQNVQPLHGRELHVMVLENTWDFQGLFEKYNCQMSGLTSTHLQPNANHLWRFERRESMESSSIVEVHNPKWQDDLPHSGDVVLSVKQLLGSDFFGIFSF